MTSTALSAQEMLAQRKSEFRKLAGKRRKEAASKAADVSAALRQAFGSLSIDPADKIISGYLPIGSEIDVLPLLEALRQQGAAIALPCVVAKDTPLVFRPWQPGDLMVEEAFGTKAPSPELAPVIPDIMLVPLLAFDLQGRRMGYGGGFYDRTLALYRTNKVPAPVVLGCAYAAQQFDEIPGDTLDQPMDAILTEEGAIQTSSLFRNRGD